MLSLSISHNTLQPFICTSKYPIFSRNAAETLKNLKKTHQNNIKFQSKAHTLFIHKWHIKSNLQNKRNKINMPLKDIMA